MGTKTEGQDLNHWGPFLEEEVEWSLEEEKNLKTSPGWSCLGRGGPCLPPPDI